MAAWAIMVALTLGFVVVGAWWAPTWFGTVASGRAPTDPVFTEVRLIGAWLAMPITAAIIWLLVDA
jgi:hypothetical protein